MPDSCSSPSFDPSLDDNLAIAVSTQTLSLTGTDTSQRNDSEGTEAIAETTADTPAHIDQIINVSSQQNAVKEGPSHSERACQSNGALSAAEPTEEMYTIAETARNMISNFGAESRATMLVPGFEGPSETTSVNHIAPKEEPDHGVLPTSITTAHEEGSDDNNDLTISGTFLVHNETGQDADETAKEDTPQDDYAESSSAAQETIADLPSPDIAQDRTRRDEGSRKAKDEAIEHEVWKGFDVRMKMLQSEIEDLGNRSAARLRERLWEAQQKDTQENEDEDGILTEIEEEFRQERDALQNDIDDLNEAFTLEFSEREFHELRSQGVEPDEEDPQEASTGACVLQTSDASNTNNDVDVGTGDAEDGPEEVDVDPEDDLEEVEVDTEDDVEAVYSNPEYDVEGKDGNGTITQEEKAEDEEVEIKVTEEPPIQPLNEQSTGNTVPESSHEISSETDPADYVGRMTITIGQENPADQIVPQQASTDATNPDILSNDNIDINKKSNDPGEDADSNSSSLNNRNDRADDADSNHDASAAYALIGPSGQQEVTLESKEAESQEKPADGFKATEESGGSKTSSPSRATITTAESIGSEPPESSGDMCAASEAEATGDAAPPGGNNDSGLSNNAPFSTAPVTNDPTSTAGHASQRRVRHHARKAKSKKYGVNGDKGEKGGS